MNAFEVIADPVRRGILEVLVEGECTSGAVAALVMRKFGITQSAVSQHLSVLKGNGFAKVRPDGTRRLYSIDVIGLREVDLWFERFRTMWEPRLEALGEEIARGKKERASGRHG